MNDVPDPLTPSAVEFLTLLSKAVVALGSIKVFSSKIYKPFMEWRLDYNQRRKEAHATTIREVLKPELSQLQSIINDETGCANQMKIVLSGIRSVFLDHDALMQIAHDNAERHDETNDLLNALGLSSDRRVDYKRRQEMIELMNAVKNRRIERERAFINIFVPEEPKS